MTVAVPTANAFTNGHTNGNGVTTYHKPAQKVGSTIGAAGSETLLARFLTAYAQLEAHKYVFFSVLTFPRLRHSSRNGKPVTVDGYNLTIADVVAVARHGTMAALDASPEVRAKVERSMEAIDSKLASGKSVYGLSTGFGGSGMFLAHILLATFCSIYFANSRHSYRPSPCAREGSSAAPARWYSPLHLKRPCHSPPWRHQRHDHYA
jgi:hypothetical protein